MKHKQLTINTFKKKNLILIGGPTASGKTSLSIKLAQHFNCPILSADSRQFYREISIGTAKPTVDELAQAQHLLINSLSIHDQYSVGQYEAQALEILEEQFQKHDYVIAVGGSGLYLKALIQGVDTFPPVPIAIKKEVQSIYDDEGIAPLQRELKEKDPVYYDQVDINNPHRLIRALTVIRASGDKFSTFLTQAKIDRPFKSIQLKTQIDRKVLYERINRRVDLMMKDGLLDEVKSVYEYKHLNSLNTVGYKEIFSFLDGACSLEFAIDKIKQHTRNYAKRQITWFNNQGEWQPISPEETNVAITYITSFSQE